MNGSTEFAEQALAKIEAEAFEAAKVQLIRLRLHFPSRRWDEEGDALLREMVQELAAMVREFGAQRVEDTITAAIRNGTWNGGDRNLSFCPRIAELRAMIAAPRWTVQPASDCQNCGGTGWRDVIADGQRKGVTRCDCRRRQAC
jgi:hypothetical protein